MVPSDLDSFNLSDPAKSTKENLPYFLNVSSPFLTFKFKSFISYFRD